MCQFNFIILLLDDSPEDRTAYRRYLQKDRNYSYTIIETDCAEFALEYCRISCPDLVLMDDLLPDMDGLEFLQKLQQFIPIQTLPILMMAGQENETLAVQAFQMGVQDYLLKTQITCDDFCYKIHQALEKDLEKVNPSKTVPVPNFPLILLAKDNEVNTTLLSEYWDGKGDHVVLAKNSLDVLKITKE